MTNKQITLSGDQWPFRISVAGNRKPPATNPREELATSGLSHRKNL